MENVVFCCVYLGCRL